MPRLRRSLIAAKVGFFALAFNATAQSLPSVSATQLLHRVDDHYNHLASMRTHFTEQYTGMGQSRTETGTLLLKKPGRMSFRYDAPAGKIFTFDGHTAWFYTPGDAQAQRIPARQLDDLHTPLRFLLGHTALEKELEGITVTPDATDSDLTIQGTPRTVSRDTQARLHAITLRVTPQGTIRLMQITEADGSATTFTFTVQEENVPTKDADFRFTPPAGVTIIDAPAPI